MPYQRSGSRDYASPCRGWQVFNASTRVAESLAPVSNEAAARVRAGAAALVPGQSIPMLGERVFDDDLECS